MKPQQPTALVPGLEPVLHYLIPDLAGGAVFCDLLEEVVVGVEEKAETRAEVVDIEAAPLRPLYVFDAVVQSESPLLQRGLSCLADVVPADGNGVELGSEPGTDPEGVHYQAHRRRRWIN